MKAGPRIQSKDELMPRMIDGTSANKYRYCRCVRISICLRAFKKRHQVRQIGGRVERLFSFWTLPPLTTVSFSWCPCVLSLVPGSVGRAPPLPLRGSGRSSSGSADASRGQEVYSVCGDETRPPSGLRRRCH